MASIICFLAFQECVLFPGSLFFPGDRMGPNYSLAKREIGGTNDSITFNNIRLHGG